MLWEVLPSLASTLGIVAIALWPGGDEHAKAIAIGALAGLTAPIPGSALARHRGNPGHAQLVAPSFSERR